MEQLALARRPGITTDFPKRPGGVLGDLPPARNPRVVELTEIARIDRQDRRICRPDLLISAGPPGQTTCLV